VLGSCLLAQRSLHVHVEAVARSLDKEGIEAARQAVSMVVGRDTAELDEAAVSRAAIESLAENFSDGVVAPLFWMAIAGLPGGIAYKAINTADSMIGHKSPRHLAFGWAAARLDDLINLPASRLSLLWLAIAAALTQGASPQRAWQAALRDAGRHQSPNAGWPEAAMAGALGIRLAGPRVYDGESTDEHWMGDGRADLGAADIRSALSLYRKACLVQIAVLAIFLVVSLPS
jgi:adenosylcobinamide-phosphate synthase